MNVKNTSSKSIPPTEKTTMIGDIDTAKLRAADLEELRKYAGLNQHEFATLSNNSRETVIKFEKTGEVSAAAKRSMTEAVRLILGLSDIMEPQNIATWVQQPNPGLRNQTPPGLIAEGRIDIIWSIIERARQGSFA